MTYLIIRIKIFLAIFFGIAVLSTTSCKDEVDCLTKYDRSCFIGTYNVNENCQTGNWNYMISVIKSETSSDGLIIENFGDYGVNVRATTNENNLVYHSLNFSTLDKSIRT